MHPLVLFLYGIWIIALYVLPTAIAFSRKKKHRWIIAVINILGGWIYGVPWLISLVWALLRLKTDGRKGFKAWPVGLGLVVAPFLFGALGAAINPRKETKEVVQASAPSAVHEAATGILTATPAQESAVATVPASMTLTASPAEQPATTPSPVATPPSATPTPVATPKPAATPKAVATPSPTPKPGRLHTINNDVLAAYSKEDFTEMMDMYAIHDTDAVKLMVSEGKVVGLRKGALVYLENVDVRDRIVQVRPKGSSTTVWIPSQFLD
jgi:hypothetical protein